MRHRFEDSCDMYEYTEWRNKPKKWFYNGLELAKCRISKKNCIVFVAKIWTRKLYTNFSLLLYANNFINNFTLNSTGFNFLFKIMGGNYAFCCSSRVSINPTNYPNP